jgi:D-alanyl-D-alanine carboxypeptidase/D-alanyl-D-alanine-endopeptidase (penicillin-binding protein 4)
VSRRPPALVVPQPPPCTQCTPSERIERELAAALSAPELSHAVWSVLVQSLDTGEVLYRLNPDTLVVPASNQKIVSMATAAAELGWDYRYETRLETAAPIEAGTLRGDLVVVGTGDPSLNARHGDRDVAFKAFAEALRTAGVTRIEGRVVGDDNAFDDERYGGAWHLDYLAYGYAAPIGALQYNENVADVTVTAGAEAGAEAQVLLQPDANDLVIVNRVKTAPAGTQAEIDIWRFPGQTELRVTGSIGMDAKPWTTKAAVDNPTLYFARALRATLVAAGIEVVGPAVDIDDEPATGAVERRAIATHQSPPLSEIGKVLMKVSQNLYAETVQKTLSARPGPASTSASRRVQERILSGWGIAPGQYAIADGSGLSRVNFVSASMIMKILRAMARDPALAAAFEATLPIAGKDGTISGRMKATRAEDNARAKTGSLQRVRSLSGYVRTADNERLAFSIIANNFMTPTASIDAVVDHAVERLANFSRTK